MPNTRRELVVSLHDVSPITRAESAEILAQWGDYRSRFVKVFPKEYRRALGELAAAHKKAAA